MSANLAIWVWYSILKPAEIINAYYQNQSCNPFTPTTKPCELGNYAVYSINVTGANDVIAGIQFAAVGLGVS